MIIRTPKHPVPHAAHEARRNGEREDRFVPERGERIKKINWWHEQISDWMILYPDQNLKAAAEYFNVTQPWLSSVINSDLFKEFHRLRMEQHREEVSRTVIERTEGLAHLTLEVLHDRIEKEREAIGLGLVRETAQMALTALGYTARSNAAVGAPVEVNVNVVGSDVLARAREKMHARTKVIEDESGSSGEGQEALPAPT